MARLEKEHVRLQERADALEKRYFIWEKEITGGDSTRHVPGLDRTSIWVGDLGTIVESDTRFITEVGRTAETIPEDKTGQAAFTEHYEELLEGHTMMVQEFGAIADKAEKKMTEQPQVR